MGGTKTEIYKAVEQHVATCFRDARSAYLPVHDFDLRRWGFQKAVEFPEFPFKGSKFWLHCFKKRHGIVSRKIQKFVSFRAIRDEDLIMERAQTFREEMLPLIAKHDPKQVLNSDQTGFRYELLSTRTLSNQGERYTMGAANSPKNKATHSYSVQYLISLEGSIVGDAYICLQEKNSAFGPTVESSIFPAPNLTISCSKSGKFTTKLVEHFLDTCVKPNVSGDVLYILDHWGGQTDTELYTSRFNNDSVNMTVKFVPQNCTDHVQPLDMHFHRQLKFLVKQMYDFVLLHEKDQASMLSSRNGILRVQSLTHFILSAPCFKPMIQYSWFASGLLEGEKPVFENVKTVCFNGLGNMKCSSSSCSNNAFIRCSWCKSNLCFEEFYHQYHVMICSDSPWVSNNPVVA